VLGGVMTEQVVRQALDHHGLWTRRPTTLILPTRGIGARGAIGRGYEAFEKDGHRFYGYVSGQRTGSVEFTCWVAARVSPREDRFKGRRPTWDEDLEEYLAPWSAAETVNIDSY
jgi:hypothetical protein